MKEKEKMFVNAVKMNTLAHYYHHNKLEKKRIVKLLLCAIITMVQIRLGKALTGKYSLHIIYLC